MSMSVIAFVRPDSWNFPLFVHIVGATILVGGLLTERDRAGRSRKATRSCSGSGTGRCWAVSLPGYVIMRIGAEWIYAKENWDDVPDSLIPAWLEIGYIIADLGAVVLLIALIVGGIGVLPDA